MGTNGLRGLCLRENLVEIFDFVNGYSLINRFYIVPYKVSHPIFIGHKRKTLIQNILTFSCFNITKTVKPANIYLFNVSDRHTGKRCEICPKLTIKTQEHFLYLLNTTLGFLMFSAVIERVLVSLLSALNMFHIFF